MGFRNLDTVESTTAEERPMVLVTYKYSLLCRFNKFFGSSALVPLIFLRRRIS